MTTPEVDVVAAERRSAETGKLSAYQEVASDYLGRDGLVALVSRSPDLGGALCVADLVRAIEVPGGCRAGARGSGGEVRAL